MSTFNISLPSDKENYSRDEVVKLLKTAYEHHSSTIEKQRNELDKLEKQKEYWANEHEKSLKLIVENFVQKIELEELNKKLKTTLNELEKESKTDYLTKLLNRGALIETLQNEIKIITRTKDKVIKGINELKEHDFKNINIENVFKENGDFGTLVTSIIDIDHFKKINDTFGHLVGDNVLKKIGHILNDRTLLRSTDISGRFGGEEFLVIFPQTGINHAMVPIKKIFDMIKTTEFISDDNRPFNITVSIGIAEYDCCDSSIEDMIKRADAALYYAKEHGRSKIIVYSSVL